MSLLLITVLSLTLTQVFLFALALVFVAFILSKIYDVPFLILFGIFLLITAKWSEFFKESKMFKRIQTALGKP